MIEKNENELKIEKVSNVSAKQKRKKKNYLRPLVSRGGNSASLKFRVFSVSYEAIHDRSLFQKRR